MRVSVEVLYHYNCPDCDKWWSVADISSRLGHYATCPHCAARHKIDSIINGRGEQIQGVSWLRPEQIRPAIVLEGKND